MRYKFTDKEIVEILSSLTVIVDTREQENRHILSYFNKEKIPYKIQKVDYGDYTCMLPRGTFKGQQRDIYFDREIAIERKFCIDELAANLKDKKTNINEINQDIINLMAKNFMDKMINELNPEDLAKEMAKSYLTKVLKSDYNRIKQELTSMNKYDIKFYIFMEDVNFDRNLKAGRFYAQYNPDTLRARLDGLQAEFNTQIRPVAKEFMGERIHNTLKYFVRNNLVHEGLIEKITI